MKRLGKHTITLISTIITGFLAGIAAAMLFRIFGKKYLVIVLTAVFVFPAEMIIYETLYAKCRGE